LMVCRSVGMRLAVMGVELPDELWLGLFSGRDTLGGTKSL
jgi:hypothetical protein